MINHVEIQSKLWDIYKAQEEIRTDKSQVDYLREVAEDCSNAAMITMEAFARLQKKEISINAYQALVSALSKGHNWRPQALWLISEAITAETENNQSL